MTAADRERLAGQISHLAQKGAFGRAELVELVGRHRGCRSRRTGACVMTAAPLILIVEDNARNLKLVRDVLEYRRLPHAGGRATARRASRSPARTGPT